MIAFGAFLFESVHTYKGAYMKKLLIIVLFVGVLPLLAGCKWFGCSCHCESCGPTENTAQSLSQVIAVTSASEFENRVRKESKPVAVDFSATWCGACKTMKPIFEMVASELKDVVFVTVDVDTAADVAQKYNITGIPAFIFIKNGKEVGRVVGAMDKDTFKKAIEKNLR
jgi:thioredoxin 1